MTPAAAPVYRFGSFRLERAERRLSRDGQPVRLAPRAFDALTLLVTRAGSLVTREELLQEVWSGASVEDGNVTHTVWLVRRALDDTETPARYVETVPKAGYRFIAPVEVEGAGPAEPGGPEEEVKPDLPSPVAIPPALLAAATRRRRLVLAIGAMALSLAVVAGWWWRAQRTQEPVTVAVLPFEHLGAAPEDDYLAEGLAEETIASLGALDPGRVLAIGRTSSRQYRNSPKSLAEIGRELGADYLVEGSVRTEAGKLRVTSKLIRARGQVQVWSASYDREPRSLLDVQQELSRAIVGQIGRRLSATEDPLAARQTTDPAAYDLYLRGRYLWNQLTPATNRQAIDYYRRAIALDPDYALAWAGIALTDAGSPINSDTAPREVWQRAREAASKAVALNPDLPETQTSYGLVLYFLDWDWPAAETALRRAVEIDPGYALGHRMLGHLLSQTGRHAEAAASLETAIELDPFYAMNHAIASQVAFQSRDFSGAIEHARRAIALDAHFWIGHVQLAQAALELGQTETALDELAEAARFSGFNSKALGLRGYALARAGRNQEARDLLEVLEAAARERYVPPYNVALVHAGLGDFDAAIAELERAYEAHDVHLVFLPVDPKWDPFRTDPRFARLLARCGFSLDER